MFLTGMETDPGAGRRKGIPFAVKLQGIRIPFFADQRYEAGNINRSRARALAGRAHQSGTDTGPAFMLADMLLILIAEVTNGRQDGIGSGLSQSAKCGLLDLVAQGNQLFDIALLPLPVADPLENFKQALVDFYRDKYPSKVFGILALYQFRYEGHLRLLA